MEIVYNIDDVNEVAKQLVSNLKTKTIVIYGEMGAGKTTLIKAIVKILNSTDEVSSPTFSIVNEYSTNETLIYHFDLYRINDLEEAYNFGIEEYIYSDNWSIIEWPQIIEDILPEHFDRVELTINLNNSRTLKLI
ncbi:tRNA threonylcarbamoyladenosine biosynthesis protein TsaE [Pseudalgibacter alginicilyticus]|uniref:tRNA threonylcarbamoyladenosine biosynthesis protein TsaE n=1 Tax=Pseudalgibacter alginicilyticus TaxID=1736674 RepID=A0A0P0CKA0_9FLAO|nr:tRNA (adenosine(37)-N6)-threonylcarbamoyltransferase complex ATPase subunit type 1 TsaE [Pseudalgibacter alginicilyticus]ALJ06690.1 tRNA threonylcarbamoyladenosine biosynthesis protein TsaE [Pseudalgibacter alginicilyticus]